MRSSSCLLLLLACLPLGLAACGDDDDGDGGGGGAQVFEVQANEDGVTAPGSADAGAVEVRFTNVGKGEHSAQVIEIGDGHTAAEALKAGEAWGEKGEALPEWVRFAGGIGTVEAGESGTAVLDLPEGEYAVFDIDSDADDAYAEFTVEGDGGEELPSTDGTIEAVEYSFETSGLTAGTTQVRVENTGDEPHHVIGAPLRAGKTIDDVKEFIQTEKGEPPIDESKGVNTAILDGGASSVVELELDGGEYAFLCFIPDRAGGPPHAVKGMVTTGTVE